MLNFAAGGSNVRGVFNTPMLSPGGTRGWQPDDEMQRFLRAEKEEQF